MVTVKEFHIKKGCDGSEYISLELTGEVCFVQSQNPRRFYARVKRFFMFATIDPGTAKGFIGTKMPRSIERVSCEQY